MQRTVVIHFIITLAVPSFSAAAVTKLPPEDRKVLEDSSRFQELYVATKLPRAIVGLCADDRGRFAEPGQNWRATDAVSDDSLPRKRLIWAAVGGEYYVVHYERGGRGHSFHVLIATFAKGDQKPKVVWRGVGERLKNYSAFLSALRSGKLDDRLDYAH